MRAVIICLLVVVSTTCTAQLTFLRQPQKYVEDALKKDTSKILVEGSTLANGDTSLLYDDKYAVTHGYVFRKGVCIKYIMGGQKSWLPDFLSNFINPVFTKIGDTEYISQNLLYKVKINFVDDSFFAVYEKI